MRRRLPSKSIAHWLRLHVATRQRLAMATSALDWARLAQCFRGDSAPVRAAPRVVPPAWRDGVGLAAGGEEGALMVVQKRGRRLMWQACSRLPPVAPWKLRLCQERGNDEEEGNKGENDC